MKQGEFVWFDIPVTDFKKAKLFYSKLLGWKFQPMGDEYFMIQVGKELIGGLRKQKKKPPLGKTPVMYFSVTKLAPATTLAKKLGATPLGERVDIPNNMGCFQILRDPDKNLFGIWAKG